jgi:hypothetical protein
MSEGDSSRGLRARRARLVAWTIAAGAMFAALSAAAQEAPPQTAPGVRPVPSNPGVFKADPRYQDKPYDPGAQIDIYGGKRGIDDPKPLLELGRPLYREGPLSPGVNVIGEKNLLFPGFVAFGDWRNVVAYNDNGKNEKAAIATRLNLDLDLRLTTTERLHAFFRPLDRGGAGTRFEFAGPDKKNGVSEWNAVPQTLFFEGDFGQLYSGFSGEYSRFDLPFTVGLIPMIFQNGIWVEDAFWGGAFTIPAKNSPWADISNMDLTFFAGVDKVTSVALKNKDGSIADHNANIFGAAGFVEALEGYWEGGFGRVQGKDQFNGVDYNSATLAYTRRYGDILSNSLRGIWTFGQQNHGKQQTADGFVFLVENSLITRLPSTLVPYFNGWVGLDRPVPLARAEGGLLKNTGINFETDGVTGFPKLDDSGQDTFGGALGIQYLFNFDQQIVLEAATVQVIGGNNEAGRPAKGDQYGIGIRYQIPLTLDWILRFDAMHGFLINDRDFSGARVELRKKF